MELIIGGEIGVLGKGFVGASGKERENLLETIYYK